MRFQGTLAEDVVAALKRRGFTYRHRDVKGWLCFDGKLNANGEQQLVQLKVPPGFDEQPRIQLVSKTLTARILPHLNPEGGLCYIAQGSLVFDWFNAIENTIACIDRAEVVLSKVLSGGMVEDLAQEFFAYWGNSALCLYDFDPNAHKISGGAVRAFVYPTQTKTLHALVTDDRMRTNAKLRTAGWRTDGIEANIVSLKTSIPPFPCQDHWPPKTVDEILAWQRKLSLGFSRHLERQLLHAYATTKHSFTLVVIESPQLPYAFLVKFDTLRPVKKRKTLLPALLRQPVSPLDIIRLDDGYITQRNLVSGNSLAGKRVVLVGCGTIGGYLADMLVKAGAGSSGGKLTLVDNDRLGPHNIGRHRLGLESVYQHKAKQLQAELVRSSPSANVWAVVDDVKSLDLSSIDLLIDATGEQAITEWLTWKYAEKYPILACWVEGAGAAVRALLKAEPNQGCSRCLSQMPTSQEYRVFVDPPETVLRGYGCESLYVPFPASASIQAAALAMEMVQSWLDGVSGPSLRSRALDLSRQVNFLDGILPRTESCPACSS